MAARDNDSVKFVVGYALDLNSNYQQGRDAASLQRRQSYETDHHNYQTVQTR